MQVSHRTLNGVVTLSLKGRFDFNTHRDFRDGYEAALNTSGLQSMELDMGGVEYLDSSALGMLLLLKERAGARNIQVKITNTTGTVRQILDIANFSKLFTIV